MTLEERDELINVIKTLPKILSATISHLTDEQLDTPYGGGKWTVRQVVHHLADSHVNGFARLKMMLTEDNPSLKPYDQDKWARLSDTINLPTDHSMKILEGLHFRWGVILDNMTDEDFKRTGHHPEDGDVNLEWHLKAYSNHCDKHLQHIIGLLKSKDW